MHSHLTKLANNASKSLVIAPEGCEQRRIAMEFGFLEVPYSPLRENVSVALVPPKPKLFDIAV